MLWLFGQIWLWLLIAFLLGAAVASLLFVAANRRRPEQAYAEPLELPESEQLTDETQSIEPVGYEDADYEDPQPAYPPPRHQNDWPPEDVDVTGHREGHLPAVGDEHAWHYGDSGDPDAPAEPVWPAAEPRPGY
jgi:hypothetical protein